MLKAAKIRHSSFRLTTIQLLGPEDLIKMLNAATGPKNILDWVENWVSTMNYFKNSYEQGDFFFIYQQIFPKYCLKFEIFSSKPLKFCNNIDFGS